MNFEPQKFFIGLIDFFSVWLPGALLTYLLKDEVAWLFYGRTFALVAVEDWAVFLFVSYLVGHVIFALGAILDELLYDPLRDGTRMRQIDRLAAGMRRSFWFVRLFGRTVFTKYDGGLRQAARLRNEQLEPANAAGAVNIFQWCRAKLALEHREALAEVERLEADSKFFRSFCVIVLVVVLWRSAWLVAKLAEAARGAPYAGIYWGRSLGLAALGLLIFGFALWRYAERRGKATGQAYWFVLVASAPKRASHAAALPAPDAPTHAGGLVLRREGGKTKYLRVRESGSRRRWVLPKGHIEADEKPAQTAVREVLEEAAIWARVRDVLTSIDYEKDRAVVRVQFFLMEYLGTERRAKQRRHRWLPEPKPGPDDPRDINWAPLAKVADLPPESRKVVAAAARYLRRGPKAD